jgi:hypothetical protein
MPVIDLPSFDAAATDLTLFRGAESFVWECAGEPLSDPDGRKCLATLIDLIVNTDSLYLTFPRNEAPSGLSPRLREFFKSLPDAALVLTEETESNLRRGFCTWLLHRGRGWTAQWVNFHLRHPLNISGHSARLGGPWITEEAHSRWSALKEETEFSAIASWPAVIQGHDLPWETQEELRRTGLSAHDFGLCYAFSVYRRGWQYLERVRTGTDMAAYVPHRLRSSALDLGAGIDAWSQVSFRQENLWSWGSYLCEVLGDEKFPSYRSVDEIGKLVGRVKNAMAKTSCPTWNQARVFDADGQIVDLEYLQMLQEWVRDTAQEAGLPLLRRLEGPVEKTTRELAHSATGTALEAAVHAPVELPLKLAKISAGVLFPKTVARADTWTTEAQRRLAAKVRFLRADFEYRGLLPFRGSQ